MATQQRRRLTPEQRHNARIIGGIGACTWEIIALALDRPDLLPRITDVGRLHPVIGGSMAAWVAGHLLQPSLASLSIRLRARAAALRART